MKTYLSVRMVVAVCLFLCLNGYSEDEHPAAPPSPPAREGTGPNATPFPPPPSPPSVMEESVGIHPPEGGTEDALEPDARALLEEVMLARLMRDLGLGREEGIVLVGKLIEIRDRMRRLREQRAEAVRSLRGALDQNAEEGAVNEQLQALMNIDREIAAFREKAFEEASQGLTETQRAKLYITLSDLEERLRRILQQARQRVREHRKPGGPPVLNGQEPRPAGPPLPPQGRPGSRRPERLPGPPPPPSPQLP